MALRGEFMNGTIFKKIIEAAQNKSLVFFVGAGVSQLSGAPSWKKLINDIAEELGQEPQEKYSYDECLRIPQMYYYSIGSNDEEYYRFVEERINDTTLLPNEIHKLLFDLNPIAMVTTNFDNLLEDAAAINMQSFVSVASDADVPSINGNKYILKLHGDFKHSNIVLKEEDYLNYSEKFKLIETLLKSIFATNTVVFIGYSLNDYNIRLILNWTKTLLKDNFNKPVFIYTDDTPLTDADRQYQESKGLAIVDYRECCDDSESKYAYEKRYRVVLEAIKKSSVFELDGKDKFEAFGILYDLLSPLNKLQAIRHEDIRKNTKSKITIEEIGRINAAVGDNILLTYYLEICEMSEEDKNLLPSETMRKYNALQEIFAKARIYACLTKNEKVIKFNNEPIPFGDALCISFDYLKMMDFVNHDYADVQSKYKKAYYLAKLHRFKDSYELFSEVACQSFAEGEYLLHFMAQANRKTLFTAIENVNGYLLYYNQIDVENIKGGKLDYEQVKYIFDSLPVEFQNAYQSLIDLTSSNILYQNSHECNIIAQKLQRAIDKETNEIGLTSCDKVICKINSCLHFYLGNGLFMDEFSEFKSAMKNLMSLLIYKYSIQSKTTFHKSIFGEHGRGGIIFDENDFYCMVEYFDSKEIGETLYKYGVDTLRFNNESKIHVSIRNLIEYYKTSKKSQHNIYEILQLQNKIKTCLVVSRHIDLPQDLVDYICDFLFKNDFREINISDKILFIDQQLYRRRKYSEKTASIIEAAFLKMFDAHIKSKIEGTEFHLYTPNGRGYGDLIRYVVPPENKYVSRKISNRVARIIDNSLDTLKNIVMWDCYEFVSPKTQQKILEWVEIGLQKTFSFNEFVFLINYKKGVSSTIVRKLKNHLNKTIQTKEPEIPYQVYPISNPFSDLEHTGYLCFDGHLPQIRFRKYLGHSDKFDFYYLKDKFDFSKFQISWALEWTSPVKKTIFSNRIIKEKVRDIVLKELQQHNLTPLSERNLQRLLLDYLV